MAPRRLTKKLSIIFKDAGGQLYGGHWATQNYSRVANYKLERERDGEKKGAVLPLVIAEFSPALLLCADGYISIDHCTTHNFGTQHEHTWGDFKVLQQRDSFLCACNNTSPGVSFFLLL